MVEEFTKSSEVQKLEKLHDNDFAAQTLYADVEAARKRNNGSLSEQDRRLFYDVTTQITSDKPADKRGGNLKEIFVGDEGTVQVTESRGGAEILSQTRGNKTRLIEVKHPDGSLTQFAYFPDGADDHAKQNDVRAMIFNGESAYRRENPSEPFRAVQNVPFGKENPPTEIRPNTNGPECVSWDRKDGSTLHLNLDGTHWSEKTDPITHAHLIFDGQDNLSKVTFSQDGGVVINRDAHGVQKIEVTGKHTATLSKNGNDWQDQAGHKISEPTVSDDGSVKWTDGKKICTQKGDGSFVETQMTEKNIGGATFTFDDSNNIIRILRKNAKEANYTADISRDSHGVPTKIEMSFPAGKKGSPNRNVILQRYGSSWSKVDDGDKEEVTDVQVSPKGEISWSDSLDFHHQVASDGVDRMVIGRAAAKPDATPKPTPPFVKTGEPIAKETPRPTPHFDKPGDRIATPTPHFDKPGTPTPVPSTPARPEATPARNDKATPTPSPGKELDDFKNLFKKR